MVRNQIQLNDILLSGDIEYLYFSLRTRPGLVAKLLHFKPFWNTMIPYRTESVHNFLPYELGN